MNTVITIVIIIIIIIIIDPEIVIPAAPFLVSCQPNKTRKAWQTKSWFRVV